MKKALAITAVAGICVVAGCKSDKSIQPATDEQLARSLEKPEPKEIVGGWYPVFFNEYDQKKVDSIIKTIAENRAKRVTITYDENKELADKILESIQSQLNYAVEMNHVAPKDGTAKFDHSRVVVIVYQK